MQMLVRWRSGGYDTRIYNSHWDEISARAGLVFGVSDAGIASMHSIRGPCHWSDPLLQHESLPWISFFIKLMPPEVILTLQWDSDVDWVRVSGRIFIVGGKHLIDSQKLAIFLNWLEFMLIKSRSHIFGPWWTSDFSLSAISFYFAHQYTLSISIS